MSFGNNNSFGIQIDNNENMDIEESLPSQSTSLLTSLITSKINTSLFNLFFILNSKLKQNVKRIFFYIKNSFSDENLEKKLKFGLTLIKIENNLKLLLETYKYFNNKNLYNNFYKWKFISKKMNLFEKIEPNLNEKYKKKLNEKTNY